MDCVKCGAAYEQAGNSDDGYVRTICSCERDEKCGKCKRGDFHPVNQALLDLDYEVRRYACSKHGHLEAESFPIPEKLIEVKAAFKFNKEPKGRKKAEPPPKREPKPRPVVVEKPRRDLRNIDEFKADLASSKEIVICTDCDALIKFNTFNVVLDEHNLPRPLCPICGKGRAQFLGRTG